MRRKHKPPECVLVEMRVTLASTWKVFGFVVESAKMNVPYGEWAQYNLAVGDDGPTDYLQFRLHRIPKQIWWKRALGRR